MLPPKTRAGYCWSIAAVPQCHGCVGWEVYIYHCKSNNVLQELVSYMNPKSSSK